MVRGSPPGSADVVVVGGGPAGLAAALAARQRGFAVVLVDRATPPIGKACGEGLMSDGVAALRALGVSPSPMQGRPFFGIRFVDAEVEAEARFRGGSGLGMRRDDLHRLLVEHAEHAGVITCWRSSAERFEPEAVTIGGERVRCRWIVGADGLHSRVRQWAGLGDSRSFRPRIGIRQHYRVRPWSDMVEVHWHSTGQAYVTPVAADEVCVAVLNAVPAAQPGEIAARFPRLAARLYGAERIGPMRGGSTITRRLRAVTRGRVALIGDASGSVDAITGEGMALAFRQAASLAACLAANDLPQYEHDHRRLARRPAFMAEMLLLLGGDDQIRQWTLRGLAACPRVFEWLLTLHVGAAALAA